MSSPRKRQKWTPAEDEALLSLMSSGFSSDWIEISRQMSRGGFCKNPKQICERWKNVLDPRVDRTSIVGEEVALLFRKQNELKTRWSLIAEHFPQRTDNAVKNKFFSLIRFALRRANRLVRCFSSTRLVNALKPKAILNFLEQTFELQAPPCQLPFTGSRVSGRDFVLFFVSPPSAKINYFANATDRELVLRLLNELTLANENYIEVSCTSKTRKIKKSAADKPSREYLKTRRPEREGLFSIVPAPVQKVMTRIPFPDPGVKVASKLDRFPPAPPLNWPLLDTLPQSPINDSYRFEFSRDPLIEVPRLVIPEAYRYQIPFSLSSLKGPCFKGSILSIPQIGRQQSPSNTVTKPSDASKFCIF